MGGFRLVLAPCTAEGNDVFGGFFLEPSQIFTHLTRVEVEFGCVLFATLPDLFNDRIAPSCFSLHRNLLPSNWDGVHISGLVYPCAFIIEPSLRIRMSFAI